MGWLGRINLSRKELSAKEKYKCKQKSEIIRLDVSSVQKRESKKKAIVSAMNNKYLQRDFVFDFGLAEAVVYV